MGISDLLIFGRWLLCVCVALAWGVRGEATTVVPPSFPELVKGADYVVRARVTAVQSVERTLTPGKTRIYTHVTLDVLEVIAGNPPPEVVLTMLGGEVGNKRMRVAGAPQFAVGDEDVLFVSGNGRNFHPLYAVMHGRYPVRKDGGGRAYIARSNDVPLTDAAEIGTPMAEGSVAQLQRQMRRAADAMSPEAFAAKIRELRPQPEEAQHAR